MLGWSNLDSRIRYLWWEFLRCLCYLVFGTTCRFRAWGMRNIPKKGAVLLISNHQSYLDPIFIGMAITPRTFHAMARSTLFHNPFFGWLLRSIKAFEVERGEADMGAIRHAIEMLKNDRVLMLFPEGTRSPDGTVKQFTTGTMLLIRRARPTVLPAAIHGAHEAWPKGKWPRIGRPVSVQFGKPIPADELIEMGPEAAMTRLRDTIESMRQDLAVRRR